MSTRGTFILAKGNAYKEIYIWCDAYPDWGGREVVRLVKTVDLERVFDHLIPYFRRKWKPDDEDIFFSAKRIEDAVRTDARPYYCVTEEPLFIQDSLMCEYGYLVDLDKNTLEYYTNKEPEMPQEENRFGKELRMLPHSAVECYPCGLRAVFSFQFIKEKNTSDIVDLMEEISKDQVIHYF